MFDQEITKVVVDKHGEETVFSSRMSAHFCDKSVWWLHVPKCGTSFHASTSQCRQERGRTSANHQNLPKIVTEKFLSTVVSIFRQPEDRLLSAYHWIKKDHGCCKSDWGWNKHTYKPVRKQISKGNTPAKILLKNFMGCQTNMITGNAGCMSGHHPGEPEIKEAIRRVGMFGFVGLITEWKLSMCLFNFFTTGNRFIHLFQLRNSRPTNGNSKTEYDLAEAPVDSMDGAVYKFAEERFWNDIKKNNITPENCKVLNDGQDSSEFFASHTQT